MKKRAESGFHDMNPSTDEDEMASSDSNEHDDEDEDDSDPTTQRERIRRNHVWAIISLLEEQAKGSYHLMVFAWWQSYGKIISTTKNIKKTSGCRENTTKNHDCFGGVTHTFLCLYIFFFKPNKNSGEIFIGFVCL